ncbi:MAG: phage holin family protein [Bacteroidota bacterium]
MLESIVQFIATPIVLLLVSGMSSKVYVKNFGSALITSLAISIVGFLIGWLITLLLNLATLGLFWLVGLGIITRTIANAVVIEIVDQFSSDFHTTGFSPSLLLAIILAVVWGIIGYVM